MSVIEKASEKDFEEMLRNIKNRVSQLKSLEDIFREKENFPDAQSDSYLRRRFGRTKISMAELAVQVEYLSKIVELLQDQISALYEVNISKDVFIENQSLIIASFEDKIRKLNENSFSYIFDQENGLSTQYLNVEIYLDSDDYKSVFQVYIFVLDFLKDISFEEFMELEAVKGSWWKRIMFKSTAFLSREQVTERLKEAEYALEVQILKSQSEVDKNQSEALSNVITSLKDIPNAAIRIGSLLVVKTTSETGEVGLVVQTLSLSQLHHLNKNPSLLTQPKNILEKLSFGNDLDLKSN